MVHWYQDISFLWPNQNYKKFTLLVPICYMNYSIWISSKFSHNWNPCGDCRWSCFATDSSKLILREKKLIQNKKVSLATVLPYQHPCGCYNSMNKWHLQNSHVCKKLNKKVTNCLNNLYGLDTINGHHQPRDWKPTQRIGEASVNHRCSG